MTQGIATTLSWGMPFDGAPFFGLNPKGDFLAKPSKLSADQEERSMELPEVQPLLRMSSILQWLVIGLVFVAGTLQLAKIYIDKRIDSLRSEIVGAEVEAYEKTMAELTSKLKQPVERKQTLVEKSKERRIPDHMIPQVKEELSKFDGAGVRLTCDRSDAEALSFAEQLKGVFEEAGWAVAGIMQTRHAKPLMGVVIILNHEKQKQKANYIFSLLMALDVNSFARLNKNQQEDLEIIVGQREIRKQESEWE
jgi:hypothetical protein